MIGIGLDLNIGYRGSAVSDGATLAPANTVAPVISGTAKEGETLSSTTGTWDNGPTSFGYQWKRDTVAIGGATASTYSLVAADEATNITCTVTAANSQGSDSATSNILGPVASADPVNSVAPVITGTTTEGETLTVSDGTWSETPTFTYQWKRDTVAISGATASTHVLVSADVGTTITCTVTATNAFGSDTADAAGVGPISAESISAPVITQTSAAGTNPPTWEVSLDGTVQVGDTLRLEHATDPGFAGSTVEDEVITSDVVLTGQISYSTFTGFAAAATVYWRTRVVRGALLSNWSNTLSDTMSAAFTPASVTGIVDYFEVRAAKLWQDTAGTIPVTTDGDLVARHDGELGIITRLQATSANRPIYRVSGGVEYLEFDGVNDYMQSAAFGSVMTQPFYWSVAAKIDSIPGTYQLTDGLTSGGRAGIFIDNDAGTNYWRILAGVGTVNWGLTPTVNDSVVAALFNGASSKMTLDGVDGITASAGTNSLDGTIIGIAFNGTSVPWDGRYYGDVLVDADPTSGEKNSITTWLAALQGRTL